jgi:D-glycero-D-manno-heptose 1,7-bisphosphate phosphatase
LSRLSGLGGLRGGSERRRGPAAPDRSDEALAKSEAQAKQGRRGAVFLDRDGVINRPIVRDGRPYSPASLEEFEILPDVPEACEKLREAGYQLFIATNQPDVGRGILAREKVEEMHKAVLRLVPIDGVFVCYHAGETHGEPCVCRKPKPGMLLAAAKEFGVDLAQSFMIGDRWRDMECGRRAGCRTIFVDWNYQETRGQEPDFEVANLMEAANIIVSKTESHEKV